MVTQEEFYKMKGKIDITSDRVKKVIQEMVKESKGYVAKTSRTPNDLKELNKKTLDSLEEVVELLSLFESYSRMLEGFIPPEFLEEKA